MDKNEGQSWDCLPPELLSMIFLYLSYYGLKAALAVNKQWSNIVCGLRTKAVFATQKSLDEFLWSQFPKVVHIEVCAQDDADETSLSLRSVPSTIRSLYLWANITDYQHLDITNILMFWLCTEETGNIILRAFSNLECLELRDPHALPAGNCISLPYLRSLTLVHHELQLPDWVLNMTHLQELSVTPYIKPKGVPEDMNIRRLTNMTNLTTLVVDHRSVSDVWALRHCTKLQRLHLNECNVNNMEVAMSELIQLTSLDLTQNKIERIAPFISRLSRLTKLKLLRNRVSELPDMSALTMLVKLNLSNNTLTEVRVDYLPASLTTLKLSDNKIQRIEAMFGEYLTGLTFLNVSRNRLEGVLKNVPTSLVRLRAESMQLSNIDYITCLHNLQYGHFINNNISEVPDVSSLAKLRYFDHSAD